MINNVCTLYELTNGENTVSEGKYWSWIFYLLYLLLMFRKTQAFH